MTIVHRRARVDGGGHFEVKLKIGGRYVYVGRAATREEAEELQREARVARGMPEEPRTNGRRLEGAVALQRRLARLRSTEAYYQRMLVEVRERIRKIEEGLA